MKQLPIRVRGRVHDKRDVWRSFGGHTKIVHVGMRDQFKLVDDRCTFLEDTDHLRGTSELEEDEDNVKGTSWPCRTRTFKVRSRAGRTPAVTPQ